MSKRHCTYRCGYPPHGFTLIEMLVVIAIIAILAALMTPALRKAVGTSRSIQCLNNERQLGIAFFGYVGSYNGYMPHVYDYFAGCSAYDWCWATSLVPFINSGAEANSTGLKENITAFQCPVQTAKYVELGGSVRQKSSSFGMNGNLGISHKTYYDLWMKHSKLACPSKTICITEGGWYGTTYSAAYMLNKYYLETAVKVHDDMGVHNSRINILWCDGSASSWFDALLLTHYPYYNGCSDDRWKKGLF